MDWLLLVAIFTIAVIVALSLMQFFEFRSKYIVSCSFIGILLMLFSSDICLVVCKESKISCWFLIGFIFLEDILAIIFCYITKRLKANVVIALAVSALVCLAIPTISSIVNCKQDICKFVMGGFFNTAANLIAVVLINLLK
ncbi:unnamed protein product [Trichobilharzia szidati]|nr:unnamed protein product [Trichobilharzia szidati]